MMETPQAKSIFASKSVQGATITLISSLVGIIINCAYQHRTPSKDEALVSLGFIVSFSWALVGRTQSTPVYTPDFLPGPNKSDSPITDREKL